MSFLSNIGGKNAETKKHILGLCINNNYSIAELSKELNTSIPTITKLLDELISDGFIEDMGKQAHSGGRRPSIYGLNPSIGYLVGVDVGRHTTALGIMDFKGRMIEFKEKISFHLDNNLECIERLSAIIRDFLREADIDLQDIITCGINLPGRVNSISGYSFTYYLGEDKSITDVLADMLKVPVFTENDSRAMTYGEYLQGVVTNEKNVLFLNATWGLGMGMILDGKLHYGKSGYSGEIGHFPMLSNNEICHCGKTGCLETGASGYAALRYICEMLEEGRSSTLSEKYNSGETIRTEDIIEAVLEEDVVAIEAIEMVGATLGRAIAGLINLFNPELVVIGGKLAATKEYLMLPTMSAINKYSLNIVNKDTSVKLTKLGNQAGVIGACLLSRSKLLGLV